LRHDGRASGQSTPHGLTRSGARTGWGVVLVSLFGTLLLGASESSAIVLRHTYRFDPGRLKFAESDGQIRLAAPGLPATWERGRPEIPYDVITFLVPRGARVVDVRAVRQMEHVLRAGAELAPAEPQRTDSGDLVEPPEPRGGAKTSGSPDSYPELAAEFAGAGTLQGYRLASVRVYPVRATGDRILVSVSVDLEVELVPDGAPAPLDPQRYSAAIETSAAQAVRRLVVNPEALTGYARPTGIHVESARHGFRPTQAPSLEGSPVEEVIITSQALSANFQVLADWKTQRGVPTVVRTVEWIQANYAHGSDLAENIRTFIHDAYAKWTVQYVLLGGDTDVIPARYGFSEFGPDTDALIPADLYFACLDGNWNADGDALWGEAAASPTNLVDDPDLYAEVFVGRLPVSTGADADRVVTKIKTYENPTVAVSSYQNRVLFLSEVLFPVDWDGVEPYSMDGADFSENDLKPLTTACVSSTRLYQNYTQYPGSSQLTRASTIAQLNTGWGVVNHIGHGYRYNMSVGDQSFLTSDCPGLTNGDKRFVLYFLNCTATAFDFPCLAESFLKATGGAVAVLGASRAAFAQPSRNYNIDFFEGMYDTLTAKNIGVLFTASRQQWTPMAIYDTGDHYTHFLYNLLADPEMIVHTCTLGTTAASFPSSIGLGLTNVTVNVTVSGVARKGALVCLQKGTEEYVHGVTNAAGSVTLPFVAESAGSVVVTVSGQNMRTSVGSITINTGSLPYVHVQSMTLDDDSSGGTIGNADGVLDAGEIVALNVTFVNHGGASATNVSGILRIPNPGVAVLDSTYTVGSVGIGGTVATTGQVRLLVDVDAPDGLVLPCEFRSTDGVRNWSDKVNRVVHAPKVQFVLLRVEDPAPGGNNDGTIQAGETFNLRPTFKNYGTGAVDGLQASISSSDPDIVITTSGISVGRVVPMQEKLASTTFRLQENTLDENAITLTTTDSNSRIGSWRVALRGPAAPVEPVLDATQGTNTVVSTWTPALEPDLAGYHVYRALSAAGPWTRITTDRVPRVAYYRDTGLQPSTQYYYYVTAVDSSGNQSPPSPTAHINTNPAQLSGWPIAMADVSSCPPAVGDITGDGNKEIVAGNSTLYAWDWHGIELRDDDGDPQTWGVFASEISTVTAAIALAPIVPSAPGFEVVAAAWNTGNKVFVVRGDGSFAAGWPQNPDSTSTPNGYWASPGVIDVDGDGVAEIFAASKNGNLYAWHGNGTPLGATAAWKTGLGTWTRCSPSFANLDGDPEPEIVYGSPTGTLYIWNSNGTNYPKFPMTLGTSCMSSPAIGDVNHDGIQDVVWMTDDDSLYALDTARGKRLPGWPVYVSQLTSAVTPSPALADFEFDGSLEVVVANNDANQSQCAVRVYNAQGQLRPGWPQFVDGHTSESSPIVADFSGDGIPDIVFGNEGGLIYGWDRNGNRLTGFPLTVGDFVRSTPTADDVDRDGDIDLVFAGWDKNLWIWDFAAPWNKAAAQWPTFKHDPQRTGYWGFKAVSPTDVEDEPETARSVPRRSFLAQNVPNPFNPVTSIEYGVPALQGSTARVRVQLDIFDVKGRRVRRLLGGEQAPGTYHAVWDGRDDRGAAVASGVFLYRLHIADQTLERKMVVMR
jgi:hypothetical protein